MVTLALGAIGVITSCGCGERADAWRLDCGRRWGDEPEHSVHFFLEGLLLTLAVASLEWVWRAA